MTNLPLERGVALPLTDLQTEAEEMSQRRAI